MKVMRMIRTLTAKFAALALVCGFAADALATPVAKVGSTEYETIDEAIAAWGPGKTLTLLADVTYTQQVVVEVNATKGTQNWILDLGNYRWTASGCHAFKLYAAGGTVMNQNYGLKVYANEDGGITATSKYCIECKYDAENGYRPRLEIHGGTYNSSYVVYYKSLTWNDKTLTNGPSTWFYKGNDGTEPVFNGNFALAKCPVNVEAGYFNGTTFNTYPVSDTAKTVINGGHFKALPTNGSKKVTTYNTTFLVDANGYYNVVKSVSSGDYAAQTSKLSANSMYNYSGSIYWADANMAISNLGSLSTKTVTLNVNGSATKDFSITSSSTYTIDASASGASYTGNVTLSSSYAKFVVKFNSGAESGAGYYGTVSAASGKYIHIEETTEGGVVTRTYSVKSNSSSGTQNSQAKVGDLYYDTVYDAFFAVDGNTEGKTITLLKDVSNAGILTNGKAVNEAGKTVVTFDLNGHSFGLQSAGTGNDADYELTVVDSSEDKTGKVTNTKFSLLKIALTGTGDYSGKYTLIVKGGKWRFNPEAIEYEYDGNTYDCVPNGFEVTKVVEDGITWYMVGEVPPRVAEIDGVYYETFADAIDAAEEYKAAHGTYPTITVLDDIAEIGNDDWKIADGYLVRKVYIAQIGSAGYETLADALAAVQTGDTVVMIADSVETAGSKLASGKTVTLDLNGKAISYVDAFTNAFDLVKVSGNLTVADTSAEQSGSISLTSTVNQSWNYAVNMFWVGDNGSLTINAGTFTVSTPSYGYAEYVIAASNNTGSSRVVINGGKFVGNNIDAVVRLHDQCGRNNSELIVTVNGGDFTLNGSQCDSVIWFDVQNAKDVTDNTSVAKLVVNGGTVVSTSNSPAIDFGHVIDASGLRAEINGGTFVSKGKVFKTRALSAESLAKIELSGGFFSGDEYYNDKTSTDAALNSLCVAGKIFTTKPTANGLYQIVPAATVTYTGTAPDGVADFELPNPYFFTYPSGDLAIITLASPTYTSDGSTVFAGWTMNGVGDAIAVLPAGTTGDITLVATWTTVRTIQVDTSSTEVPELKEIKVTDTWIERNVTIDSGATEEQAEAAVTNKLMSVENNGLKGWENYVLGLDGSDPNAKVAADAEQGATTQMPVASTIEVSAVDTGFTVSYQLDEVTTNGNVVASSTPQKTPDLELDLSNVKSNAYFKVTATIKTTKGEEVSTVTSTNVIGVLAVTNAPATSIVAVPWKGTDGENISVSNLVRTATLTPGDKLQAYDAATGKYRAWQLSADKTWVPTTVVGGEDATGADACKVSRGEGVWLTRQDPSQPIYLVGDAGATEKEPTALEKAPSEDNPSWNIVASPSVEPVKPSELLKESNKEGDKIIVLTSGAPKNYYYDKDEKAWGYDVMVPVYDENNNQIGVRAVFKTDDTVPAGTGFWYLNSNTEDGATIRW